jgi:hypothetical protein
MRNLIIRNSVLPASLFASFALLAASAITGCSTGSGSSGTAGTSGGTAGTSGSAGAGTAGATTTGTAGATTTGTAGSTTTGTAGATTTGTAGVGAAGATGTAGADATGTAGAPATTGVCAGAGTRPLTIAQGKIDDFEADPISTAWSSFNNLAPAGMDNSIMITRAAGGALSTGFYGHYMGTGAKTPTMGGFGVGTLYNIAIDNKGIFCVDVTAFDGLSFWAKAGTAGAHVGVNFVVPETNLTPNGDCLVAATCYNHPQKLITLTADWQQYTVTFASATGGTGAKIKGRVQQIGFLSPDANWDFSIDELQFYKGTAPATPVGGNSQMP